MHDEAARRAHCFARLAALGRLRILLGPRPPLPQPRFSAPHKTNPMPDPMTMKAQGLK